MVCKLVVAHQDSFQIVGTLRNLFNKCNHKEYSIGYTKSFIETVLKSWMKVIKMKIMKIYMYWEWYTGKTKKI